MKGSRGTNRVLTIQPNPAHRIQESSRSFPLQGSVKPHIPTKPLHLSIRHASSTVNNSTYEPSKPSTTTAEAKPAGPEPSTGNLAKMDLKELQLYAQNAQNSLKLSEIHLAMRTALGKAKENEDSGLQVRHRIDDPANPFARGTSVDNQQYVNELTEYKARRKHLALQAGFDYPDEQIMPEWEVPPKTLDELNRIIHDKIMKDHNYELGWYFYTKMLHTMPDKTRTQLEQSLHHHFTATSTLQYDHDSKFKHEQYSPNIQSFEMILFACLQSLKQLEQSSDPETFAKAVELFQDEETLAKLTQGNLIGETSPAALLLDQINQMIQQAKTRKALGLPLDDSTTAHENGNDMAVDLDDIGLKSSMTIYKQRERGLLSPDRDNSLPRLADGTKAHVAHQQTLEKMSVKGGVVDIHTPQESFEELWGTNPEGSPKHTEDATNTRYEAIDQDQARLNEAASTLAAAAATAGKPKYKPIRKIAGDADDSDGDLIEDTSGDEKQSQESSHSTQHKNHHDKTEHVNDGKKKDSQTIASDPSSSQDHEQSASQPAFGMSKYADDITIRLPHLGLTLHGEDLDSFIDSLKEQASASLNHTKRIQNLRKELFAQPFCEGEYVYNQLVVWNHRLYLVVRDVLDHFYSLIHTQNPKLYQTILQTTKEPELTHSGCPAENHRIGQNISILETVLETCHELRLHYLYLEASALYHYFTFSPTSTPTIRERQIKLMKRFIRSSEFSKFVQRFNANNQLYHEEKAKSEGNTGAAVVPPLLTVKSYTAALRLAYDYQRQLHDFEAASTEASNAHISDVAVAKTRAKYQYDMYRLSRPTYYYRLLEAQSLLAEKDELFHRESKNEELRILKRHVKLDHERKQEFLAQNETKPPSVGDTNGEIHDLVNALNETPANTAAVKSETNQDQQQSLQSNNIYAITPHDNPDLVQIKTRIAELEEELYKGSPPPEDDKLVPRTLEDFEAAELAKVSTLHQPTKSFELLSLEQQYHSLLEKYPQLLAPSNPKTPNDINLEEHGYTDDKTIDAFDYPEEFKQQLKSIDVGMLRVPIHHLILNPITIVDNTAKNYKYYLASPHSAVIPVDKAVAHLQYMCDIGTYLMDRESQEGHVPHLRLHTYLEELKSSGVYDETFLNSLKQQKQFTVNPTVDYKTLARIGLDYMDSMIINFAYQTNQQLPKAYTDLVLETSPQLADEIKVVSPTIPRKIAWKRRKQDLFSNYTELMDKSVEDRIKYIDDSHEKAREHNTFSKFFQGNRYGLLRLYLRFSTRVNDPHTLKKALILYRSTTQLLQWVQRRTNDDIYSDVSRFFTNIQSEEDFDKAAKKFERDRKMKSHIQEDVPTVIQADVTKDDLKRSNPGWGKWISFNLNGASDDPVMNSQSKINKNPTELGDESEIFDEATMLDDYQARIEEIKRQEDELRKDYKGSALKQYLDPLHVPGFDPSDDEDDDHDHNDAKKNKQQTSTTIDDDKYNLPREQGQKEYPPHERLTKLPIISHLPLDQETTQAVVVFHQHLIKNNIQIHRAGLPNDVVSRRFSDEVSSFWTLARRRLFNYRASYAKSQPDVVMEMLQRNRPSHELHDVEMEVAQIAIMVIDTLVLEGFIPTARIIAKQAYDECLFTRDFVDFLFHGSGPSLEDLNMDGTPMKFAEYGQTDKH